MEEARVEEYLKVLACPLCKGELFYYKKDKEGFYCRRCELLYPIVEDIPIMLVDSALKIEGSKIQENGPS